MPLATSQVFSVLSSPAATIRSPSGLTAQLLTAPA
jgi:hypothetical protein